MSAELQKPVIGFSCGDLNGIGLELIIKTLADHRLLDFCIPVVFASNKSVNFYRKSLADINFNYSSGKELDRLNTKQVNVYNSWEEDVVITPGQLNETGGKYALISLKDAAGVQVGRRHFGLPAADLGAFDRRTEEYAAVAIGFLFEFYR